MMWVWLGVWTFLPLGVMGLGIGLAKWMGVHVSAAEAPVCIKWGKDWGGILYGMFMAPVWLALTVPLGLIGALCLWIWG